MVNGSPYEKMLQGWLQGEFRIVNSGLPRTQESLSHLLTLEHPGLESSDGSTYFFKRKELAYLAAMLAADEQERLMLPMLIEMGRNQAEVSVICQTDVEEKVVSKVIGGSVMSERGRIRLYKPQLAVLRKVLKTATQYVFVSESLTDIGSL